MNELANASKAEIAAIDSLAAQARTLRANIDLNMWQLARVFVEAKELVPHGEWQGWLRENADVSVRTAEDMMAAWKRFGGREDFAGIGQAKAFRLLPLPEEAEDAFFRDHDVDAMSSREVQEAVKKVRAEAQREIEKERAARFDAEKRAQEAQARPAQAPDSLIDELREKDEKISEQELAMEQLARTGQESIDEARGLRAENARLQREIETRDEMLSEQQEDLNRAQAELLDLKSAAARGDAERNVSDRLTLSAFASAVRSFIGAAARLPQMGGIFAVMGQGEKDDWNALLKTVEKWANDSRRAMQSAAIAGEGSIDG